MCLWKVTTARSEEQHHVGFAITESSGVVAKCAVRSRCCITIITTIKKWVATRWDQNLTKGLRTGHLKRLYRNSTITQTFPARPQNRTLTIISRCTMCGHRGAMWPSSLSYPCGDICWRYKVVLQPRLPAQEERRVRERQCACSGGSGWQCSWFLRLRRRGGRVKRWGGWGGRWRRWRYAWWMGGGLIGRWEDKGCWKCRVGSCMIGWKMVLRTVFRGLSALICSWWVLRGEVPSGSSANAPSDVGSWDQHDGFTFELSSDRPCWVSKASSCSGASYFHATNPLPVDQSNGWLTARRSLEATSWGLVAFIGLPIKATMKHKISELVATWVGRRRGPCPQWRASGELVGSGMTGVSGLTRSYILSI